MPVTKDALLERVLGIVGEMANRHDVGPASDLAALGFDSMGKLDLLAVLEERLGVSLTEDLLPEFTSPERIADIVRELSDPRERNPS